MVLFYFALTTSSPSLFEDVCAIGPGGGFLWEVGWNWSRPESSMKDLNAGTALSETYIKASVTNRTNVLKRRQENTLDFMRTYGILLPLQKLHVLKKSWELFQLDHHWCRHQLHKFPITEQVSTNLIFIGLFFLHSNRGNSHYTGDSVELTTNRVLKPTKITG